MAQDATPTPSQAPAAPPGGATTTSADVANANALNEAINTVRNQLSTNSTAVITSIGNIATAITQKLIGGVVGTTANTILISKTPSTGTTAGSLKPAPIATFPGGGGLGDFLQISTGTAGGGNDWLTLRPTDWGTGKPYLTLSKTGPAANTEFKLAFWDGTTNTGILTVLAAGQNAGSYFNVQGTDGALLHILPSNSSGGFNPIVSAADTCLIYSVSNANNTGALVVGPQSSFAAGFRMDNNGFTRFSSEVGFPLTFLTDAATIAWNMGVQQVAQVTLGANRNMGTPTNIIAGFTYILIVVQDGTGGRTLAFPSAFKFPGGVAPVLSTAANAVDAFTFVAQTTGILLGVLQKAFA